MYDLLIGMLRLRTAKGGDFDDFGAKKHMRQLKTTPDDAAITKDLSDLFRAGIGRDVEILGFESEREVAHAAADEVGLEARLTQAVEHPQGVGGNPRTRDRMRVAWNDVGETGSGLGRGVGGIQCCIFPLWSTSRLSNQGGRI